MLSATETATHRLTRTWLPTQKLNQELPQQVHASYCALLDTQTMLSLKLCFSPVYSNFRIKEFCVYNYTTMLEYSAQSPGEVKRREVSWTLTKKLAQERSREGGGAWLQRNSWTSFASVVSQRRSYGHCLCDSVLHSSWDSNCVVLWSLRNAGRTLP